MNRPLPPWRPLAARNARPPAPAPEAAPAPAATEPRPPPNRRTGANYETLGQARCGRRTSGTLLSSFVERCTSEKRELDRARCRATTAYLRRTLPQAHVRVHDRRAGRSSPSRTTTPR